MKQLILFTFLLAIVTAQTTIISPTQDTNCDTNTPNQLTCTSNLYTSPQYAINDTGQWDWISNQTDTDWNAQQAIQQFSNGTKNVTMWIKTANGNYYTLKQAYQTFGFGFQPTKTKYKNGWKWGINFTFTPAQGQQLRQIGFTSNGGQYWDKKWCYEANKKYKPCIDLTDMYSDPNTLVLTDNETSFIINQTTWTGGWAWIDPTITINSSNNADTWTYSVSTTGTWSKVYKNGNSMQLGRDSMALGSCGTFSNANYICEAGLNFNVTNSLPNNAIITGISLFQAYSTAYPTANVNYTYITYTNQSIQPWLDTNGSNFYDYWLIKNTSANITMYQQWAKLFPELNFTVTLSNGSDKEASRYNTSAFTQTNYTIGMYLWNASAGTTKTNTILTGKTAGNCPYLTVNYTIQTNTLTIIYPQNATNYWLENTTLKFQTDSTYYNITNETYYLTNGTNTWTNTTQTNATNYYWEDTQNNLPAGTYTLNATACTSDGTCTWSTTIQFTKSTEQQKDKDSAEAFLVVIVLAYLLSYLFTLKERVFLHFGILLATFYTYSMPIYNNQFGQVIIAIAAIAWITTLAEFLEKAKP